MTGDDFLVRLTKKEAAVVAYLARHAGRTVGPGELAQHVWEHRGTVKSDAVRMGMSRLGRKLRRVSTYQQRDGGYRLEPLHTLVGRTALIEETVNALRSRSVALVGPGGVGKSAVARAAAQQVAEYPAFLRVTKGSDLLARLAAELLLSTDELCTFSNDKLPQLIVLDEAEHADPERLHAVLRLVDTRFLLTSRRQLQGRPALQVPTLGEAHAAELLRRHCTLDEERAREWAFDRWEGLPGLILLGSRFLRFGAFDAAECVSGDALLQHTWACLSDEAKRAASSLRCFQSTFSLADAMASVTEQGVIELLEFGWIEAAPHRIPRRVRTFLDKSLGPIDGQRAAAHCEWALARGTAILDAITKGHASHESLTPLRQDLQWAWEQLASPKKENVACVLARVPTVPVSHGLSLFQAMDASHTTARLTRELLRLRGGEGSEQQALLLLEGLPITGIATWLAYEAFRRGGVEGVDEALQRWSDQGQLVDPIGHANLLERRTYWLTRQGRFDEAMAQAHDLLGRYTQWAGPVYQMRARGYVAHLTLRVRGPSAALDRIDQWRQLGLWQPARDVVGAEVYSACMYVQASCLIGLGSPDVDVAREAIVHQRRNGRFKDAVGRVPALVLSLAMTGSVQEAEAWVEWARPVAIRFGLDIGLTALDMAASYVHLVRGQLDQARQCLVHAESRVSPGSDAQMWLRIYLTALGCTGLAAQEPTYPHALACHNAAQQLGLHERPTLVPEDPMLRFIADYCIGAGPVNQASKS